MASRAPTVSRVSGMSTRASAKRPVLWQTRARDMGDAAERTGPAYATRAGRERIAASTRASAARARAARSAAALAVAAMLALGLDVVPAFGFALLAVGAGALIQVARALPRGSRRAAVPSACSGSAMLSTGWPMLLGSAMFMVRSWTDTLLLGHYLDEGDVGVYRVAFRVASVITLVQAAVNSYAAPWFAERHAAGDDQGLHQALAQTTGLNVVFSEPALVALAAAPAWWLGWFGFAFEAGAACMVCLALGQLVNALCGPVMYLLNMTGHERVAQRIVWVAAILNLALNIWAIPRFGILGAAASTAATMELWNVAAAVAAHMRLGLSVWAVLRSFAQRN